MRRTYEDMPTLKYKVELNESERTHLEEIVSRGETSTRKVKRALALLICVLRSRLSQVL